MLGIAFGSPVASRSRRVAEPHSARRRTIVWLRVIQDATRTVRRNRLREYALDRLTRHDHVLYRVDAPVTPLPRNWIHRRLPLRRYRLRRVARLVTGLLTTDYDLIITLMLGSKETACAVLANVIRAKPYVVIAEHWYHRRGRFRRWWFGVVLRRCRLAVAQSTRAELFLRDGGATNVVRCVNTIEDISRLPFDERLTRRIRGGPGPRLLCVARFTEVKGQDLLVRAFRQIPGDALRLYFIGNHETEFGRRCIELATGDDRIEFLGQLRMPPLLAYYRACDLFVLPNRFTDHPIEGAESFGYAALEAAFMGLPLVLTTATGCSADLIVEGVTGHTVAAGDLPALRNRLASLLAPPVHLEELGAASADRARSICAPTATTELENALAEILSTLD